MKGWAAQGAAPAGASGWECRSARRLGIRRRLLVAAVAAVLAAGCGGTALPTSPLATPGGATASPASDPGAALAPRGFPSECPEASDSLEEINAATYQLFGENVYRDEHGQAQLGHLAFGTAWVVGERLLVTNAHVAQSYLQAAANGLQLNRTIAVQSGTGTVVRLTRALLHPAWNQNALGSPDVAVLETEQPLPGPLQLAPHDSVLGLGDEVHIVGFPADVDVTLAVVPGETVPQATSLSGRISARRAFDQTQLVTPQNLAIYQHQAPTSPGTSGSAMVHCGLVAAVNNAGTNRFVLTPDRTGTSVTVDRQPAAANNFGIHVRYIHEVVDAFKAGAAGAFALPVPAGAVATAAPATQPPGATQPPAGATQPPASATTAPGAAVSIVNLAFQPSELTVPAGTTVTWTNTADVPHTVTAEEVDYDSGPIVPGGGINATFPDAGVFRYFCAIHPQMRGSVTVVAAVPAATQQAGLAGRYSGSVSDTAAAHSFAFQVLDSGVIQGTSIWGGRYYNLAGMVNVDGSFQMTDDAPEQRGYRRGIYQGAIAPDGSIAGVYFEQTREEVTWQFSGRRDQ